MSSLSPSSSLPSLEMVVKHRFLGFLLWQSITSTFIFFLCKAFISVIPSATAFAAHGSTTYSDSIGGSRKLSVIFAPWLIAFITFVTFHLSQLLFSASISLLASPQLDRPATPLELALGFVRFLVVSGTGANSSGSASLDFRRRAKVSLSFVMLVVASAASGFLEVVSVCWVAGIGIDGRWRIGRVGYRGFAMGLSYGFIYVCKQRWIVDFPIIQRPPFFSFKMGLLSATSLALKLSAVYLFLAVPVAFLPVPDRFKTGVTVEKFIAEETILFIGSFSVFLCWELSHHLHRVLHTKRFTFAPPKGSAAAETNPSEDLLAALEESNPKSLQQYLAYLDLCMVCENNVDTWRRAAFFEETGETYKRVITVSLRPLEQLASYLSECLESSVDKTSQLSKQLLPPTEPRTDSKYYEPLNNFQLYAWCARTVASLTACSHEEDRYGVAQLSGSNAAVLSTLISCLLAVESLMGKKTSIPSSNHLLGPAGIKWVTSSAGRVDVAMGKKKGGPLHSKAYAIADVLRTSIYRIVSSFHDEMLASAKSGLLEKDWIIGGKPIFGTRELLLQKLRIFLDFRAS